MGLFDVFKKKECCICGNEVGLIGNRKLADGNMCSKCAKLLSPWFTERRESTVDEITLQLMYRKNNEKALEGFMESYSIGEYYKFHVEEVNGIPTRFVVNESNDPREGNPDIIRFRDVVSCVTNVEERETEIKEKNSEGKMVSCNPPRFKHHYEFFVELSIRNNSYFDSIRFKLNSATVTIETVGGTRSFGSAILSGARKGTIGAATDTVSHSFSNNREHQRHQEFQRMCSRIEQIVEDGKRGAATVGQPAPTVPLPAPEAVPEAPKPKFCPGCGAPADSGKFCQQCGSRLD